MTDNTGHGHVRPRPDGVKMRCGGPNICTKCAAEWLNAPRTVASPPLAPVAPAGPPKHWIQTLPRLGEREGRAFDLVKPTPDMIDFRTIAKVLARVPRFGGHTGGGVLSVAQHCHEGARALLNETGSRVAAAAFLVHDAHEAYIGDIATPVAQALADIAAGDAPIEDWRQERSAIVTRALRELKSRIDNAVYQAAGLPWPMSETLRAIVKKMDARMLETERRARLAIPPHRWKQEHEPIADGDLWSWTESTAAACWWNMATELLPALGGTIGKC